MAEPLSLELRQARIFIATENLENLHRIRKLKIDIGKLKAALEWLMMNNRLYHYMVPYFPDNIDVVQLLQLVHEPVIRNADQDLQREVPDSISRYVILSETVSILQGSFPQGSSNRFDGVLEEFSAQ